MTKIVYIVAETEINSFNIRRLDLWKNYVDIELYVAGCIYPADTVFMYDLYVSDFDDISTRLDQGYRVIINHVNEHYVHIHRTELLSLSQRVGKQICWIISGVQPARANFEIVATPYWYWIMDQENFTSGDLHNTKYHPNGSADFLCTMNLKRHERDQLYISLKQHPRPGLVSYRDMNVFIPDDLEIPDWQRRINRSWLQQTYYTIVPESYVKDYDYRTGIAITERNDEFISEKTLKPLASQHPFLLVSTRGNLQHVRDLGFETFPELFDESYDLHFKWQQRITAVLEQVKKFNPRNIENPRVREKLEYNQHRFFDRNLTDHFFKTTMVEPVVKWIDD